MIGTLINLGVFLFCLGVLILVHELGHFFFARFFGVNVRRFSIGFGKVLVNLGKDKRGTEYVISAIPLGGFIEMEGESYADSKGLPGEFMSKPLWQKALIVAAGPLVNYFIGFLLLAFVYSTGAPELLPVIGKVLDGSSAQEAGILPKDRIIAIDGHRVDLWDEMSSYIRKNAGREIVLEIKRGDKEMRIKVVPQEKEMITLFGKKERIGLIGIVPDLSAYDTIRFPLHVAIGKAFMRVKQTTVMILESLYLLVKGNKQVREAMAGPIGIYEVTSKARTLGINVLLMVLATLSISLAVFNLLPVPVLDGGHLLFFTVEAIIRRPIPEKAYNVMTNAGLGLLLCLMVFVFYNDIRRIRQHKPITPDIKEAINNINQILNNEEVQTDIP